MIEIGNVTLVTDCATLFCIFIASFMCNCLIDVCFNRNLNLGKQFDKALFFI